MSKQWFDTRARTVLVLAILSRSDYFQDQEDGNKTTVTDAIKTLSDLIYQSCSQKSDTERRTKFGANCHGISWNDQNKTTKTEVIMCKCANKYNHWMQNLISSNILFYLDTFAFQCKDIILIYHDVASMSWWHPSWPATNRVDQSLHGISSFIRKWKAKFSDQLHAANIFM